MGCKACQKAQEARQAAQEKFKQAVAAGEFKTAAAIAKQWGLVVSAGAAAMAGLISKDTLTKVVETQDIAAPSDETPKGVPAPNMKVNP